MATLPPDFSIVLPAYNEAPNVAPMLAALREVVTPLGRFEVLYIDDGSNDGTLDVLRHAAAAEAGQRSAGVDDRAQSELVVDAHFLS